jgi:hypothetical protein
MAFIGRIVLAWFIRRFGRVLLGRAAQRGVSINFLAAIAFAIIERSVAKGLGRRRQKRGITRLARRRFS